MVVALVMAGGRAARLGGLAKPLLRVCGKQLLEHVVREALNVTSRVVVAVAGDAEHEIAKRASHLLADPLHTPGKGYPMDFELALRCLRPRPVLVLPADTPFIEAGLLQTILQEALEKDKTIATVRGPDGSYTGVSVVLSPEPRDWADIVVGDEEQLLDVDDLSSLAKALSRCRTP